MIKQSNEITLRDIVQSIQFEDPYLYQVIGKFKDVLDDPEYWAQLDGNLYDADEFSMDSARYFAVAEVLYSEFLEHSVNLDPRSESNASGSVTDRSDLIGITHCLTYLIGEGINRLVYFDELSSLPNDLDLHIIYLNSSNQIVDEVKSKLDYVFSKVREISPGSHAYGVVQMNHPVSLWKQ